MTLEQVIHELTVIKEQLDGVLAESGKRAAAAVLKDLQEFKKNEADKAKQKSIRGKKTEDRLWKFEITPGLPLLFKETNVGDIKHKLAVDVACVVSQLKDGIPSGVHNIAVRVWTHDPKLRYRADWDAVELEDKISIKGRRVMLRFHFDYANPGQDGPVHHLQIGGVHHSNEWCWLPDNWKLPRFSHHPVSLIMACEFVVRTFFPIEYRKLATEPTWINAMEVAQRDYLAPYFSKLGFEPGGGNNRKMFSRSFLNALWNGS